MIYQSDVLHVQRLSNDVVELSFDAQGESVNKFDQQTIEGLAEAIQAVKNEPNVSGLLITSAKPVFIVGADITSFGELFDKPLEDIASFNMGFNKTLCELEELAFPSIVAINGVAMGGGLELCLAADFRVMATNTKIAVPEVKLGIFPGWGGTVRLPRLIGLDQAVTWICTGQDNKAAEALRVGAVDAVAEPDNLRDVALATLQQAIDGKLDYQTRRDAKNNPMPINQIEAIMAFNTMKALVAGQAGKNYPAPMAALKSIEKGHNKDKIKALEIEAKLFAEVATSSVARALVGIFMSDQALSKKAKMTGQKTDKGVDLGAVLGAGIMGGGIAYQSAYKGTPVIMKDIAQAGLDLGMNEASKLLSKQVNRKRMTPEKMAQVVASIKPSLSYEGFDAVDVVVEAVVENPKVKHAVLAETEKHIANDAVLASNTSTISINFLAEALERPENFCGMHFFNPVHSMPLVEVIRGEKTSEETIARTVAYATKMGKKAIVVNDCPGFLVNRVLFPYFDGFSKLLRDGADFTAVDKVMERFGWPMGPAYLMDVVGLDTCVHAAAVMANGFPDRMQMDFTTPTELLFNADHYGQKTGKGYYEYQPDKKGKPRKTLSADIYELIAPACGERTEFNDDDIIARMMLPMATELARCLEEGIVDTAYEADLALIYGLGFPPFRGGVFRWLDEIGLEALAAMSAKHAHLGKSYELTEGMKAKLANNETYY